MSTLQTCLLLFRFSHQNHALVVSHALLSTFSNCITRLVCMNVTGPVFDTEWRQRSSWLLKCHAAHCSPRFWGGGKRFRHFYPKPTIISVKIKTQLSIIIRIHCQPRLSQAYQFIHYNLPFTRTLNLIRYSEMCNYVTRIPRKWSSEKYYEHKNTAIFWTHRFTVNILAFVFEAGLRNFNEHCRHKSLFAFAAVATGLCATERLNCQNTVLLCTRFSTW